MLTRLKSAEAAARWLREWCTGKLCTDSRAVRPGTPSSPGPAMAGRPRLCERALNMGAATCLVEDEGVDAFKFTDARVASLPGPQGPHGRDRGQLL